MVDNDEESPPMDTAEGNGGPSRETMVSEYQREDVGGVEWS